MPQLQFVTAATTVDQGAPFQVTLHADFDGQTFGSATIELQIPATGFAQVNVGAATAFDEYAQTAPTTPLGSYQIGCARAAGSPGAIDLLTIDAVMDGLRAGTYSMTARFTDALDVNEQPLPLLSTTLTFTVTPGAVAIVTTVLEHAFQTVPYQQTLFAQGGTPPYTWQVPSGSLPAGLALDGSGVITGTPTAAGSTSVALQVNDSAGASASATVTLVVHAPPLTIPPPDLGQAAPGRLYQGVLSSTGGKPPFTWQVDGLPAGLAVASATIAGTPQPNQSLYGVVPLTLRVTDGDTPPQVAETTASLLFVPSLMLQELNLPSAGAVVVGRDLCVIDYKVTASVSARTIDIGPPASGGFEPAQDALISAIAELAAEGPAASDPVIQDQYRNSLIDLVDRYRDVQTHASQGTTLAVELNIYVDDQLIQTVNAGGQRTIHELRATAGRPLLPYGEPKTTLGREIRQAFHRGGRQLRAWAREEFDRALEHAQQHRGSPAPRAMHGRSGLASSIEDSLNDALRGLPNWLEQLGIDLQRWIGHLLVPVGHVRLTPGRHRVTIKWDGGHVINLLGGIVVSTGPRDAMVSFRVSFAPTEHTDWPRFAQPTVFSDSRPGLPGSAIFDAELSSTGVDIVAGATDGVKLYIDKGIADQPYAAAVPYVVQPPFVPERIRAVELDPYGRTSLLMHSSQDGAVVLNDGPAGVKLLPAVSGVPAPDLVCAMTAGAREASGWRRVEISLGGRRRSYHGLHGVIQALPNAHVTPLRSGIRFDEATSLAFVEHGQDFDPFLAVGFDADGRVHEIEPHIDLLAPKVLNQPVAIASGEWTGGGVNVAIALRQPSELRVFQRVPNRWVALPPVPMPVRPWDLCDGPSSAPCLAVTSSHYGSVLLVVWRAPDQPPKVLQLYHGGSGVRASGAAGTLAVSDPLGKLTVFR